MSIQKDLYDLRKKAEANSDAREALNRAKAAQEATDLAVARVLGAGVVRFCKALTELGPDEAGRKFHFRDGDQGFRLNMSLVVGKNPHVNSMASHPYYHPELSIIIDRSRISIYDGQQDYRDREDRSGHFDNSSAAVEYIKNWAANKAPEVCLSGIPAAKDEKTNIPSVPRF